MSKFYITIAIPYVNGKPHIGHALEYFQADAVRRFYDAQGFETLILSGADENALKNVQAAEKEGMEVQAFLDQNSKVFEEAFKKLGVKLDVFQRGSNKETHHPGVQKLWKLCEENGDIYKKAYEGYYCVGCESFKTEKELEEGLCPIHKTKPEFVKEENYFFELSKYQGKLIELIESGTIKIAPENKRAETLSFIKQGLEDFSISRSKDRAKGVGVPVPGDENQIIYVWYDALTIYMTGIGFGTEDEKWNKWWPADVHIIGKDINRFHTVYWPAMLLSAKLPLPKSILIHSFITSGGQKMSKSLGNVIDPFEVAEKYGIEPFRYFMLSQIPIDEDGDFTFERFKEVYTSDLSNGIGNLVARVAKLAENSGFTANEHEAKLDAEVENLMKDYKFNQALSWIWTIVSLADQRVNQTEPWKLKGTELKEVLDELVSLIQRIAYNLKPFMPETADKILGQFQGDVKSQPPLFPRMN